MKLNPEFVLQQVAGSWIVVPMGRASLDFNGMLTLNETGVVLWKALEAGGSVEDLAKALTKEYDVSMEQAAQDASAFLRKLQEAGCLVEN